MATDSELDSISEKLQTGQAESALLICLQYLASNLSNSRARLLLARIFFELQLHTFAAREVAELVKDHPNSSSLNNLLLKLDPTGRYSVGAVQSQAVVNSQAQEQVVAEADFDIDIIGELE